MKTKHIFTNLFRLIVCLALLVGADTLLSAVHAADAFTGNFTGREVKLQLKPEGSKWKGKLLLKNQPYTIQGENQRGILIGTYGNGDRNWQFKFKSEGADMTFVADNFTATLARSADDQDCIYCKGSRHCSQCQGTGKLPCSICSGTGKKDGETCIWCKGGGKVDCSVCKGSGHCTQCFGSGYKNVGCIYCKGSGHCTTCFGTGRLRCEICKGTGLESSDRKTTCSICNGRGKNDCSVCNGSRHCKTCQGTGKKQD